MNSEKYNKIKENLKTKSKKKKKIALKKIHKNYGKHHQMRKIV